MPRGKDIGYYALPIIPSIEGMDAKIGAQLDSKLSDAGKKAGQEYAKAFAAEAGKAPIDSAVREKVDQINRGDTLPPIQPKIEPKIEPEATKSIGEEIKDAITKGVEDAGWTVDELSKEIGKRAGGWIGEKLNESRVGHWIDDLTENYVDPAIDAFNHLSDAIGKVQEHDASGAIGGVADAMRDIGQSGAADVLDRMGARAGETQDKYHQLKDAIGGTTANALELTNNSGRIAGGLSTIAGAAGPLAATFAALTTLMPGFNDSLNHVLGQIQGKQGFNPNDWLHTAFPGLGLMDRVKDSIAPPETGNPLPPQRIGNNPPLPGGPIVQPGYDAHPGSLNPFDALNPAGAPAGPQPTIPNLPKSIWDYDMPDHAGGGMISGPGTGTSDSILGWPAMVRVSNKEFITNAKDTEKNRPILEAVNNGVPLWDWLRSMPGFAPGGMVGGDASSGSSAYQNLYAKAASMVGMPYSQADCSKAASMLVNAALGLGGNDRMTTITAPQWLTSKGFILGQGPPGTLRVGWYNHGPNPQDGHMAVTLPDGTHAEAGGSHPNFTLGAGAAGAESSEFEQHAYLPMNALYPDRISGGFGSPGGPSGLAGMFGGGGLAGLFGGGGTGGGSSLGSLLGGGGGSSGGGSNDLGQVGNIFGSFLKETFGLDGSVFPDISQLGVVKELNAILGLKFRPRRSGAGSGYNPFGANSPFESPKEASGVPFGMVPAAIDAAGTATPSMAGPGGAGIAGLPGIAQMGAQQIDNSRNVNIHVDQGEDIATTINRTLASYDARQHDRIDTYAPRGG